ncbi:hypothetical protein [Burkholderia seminalis]|uniref:hypothetical protein n=1 Tax=Burkholderia seminalis TaxID=488731 RepID=UPI0031D66726
MREAEYADTGERGSPPQQCSVTSPGSPFIVSKVAQWIRKRPSCRFVRKRRELGDDFVRFPISATAK